MFPHLGTPLTTSIERRSSTYGSLVALFITVAQILPALTLAAQIRTLRPRTRRTAHLLPKIDDLGFSGPFFSRHGSQRCAVAHHLNTCQRWQVFTRLADSQRIRLGLPPCELMYCFEP
ncbi:hypothetical protein B0H10DRAFT_2019560 [Mycena sp. CBHHK59/15]|nr:hypothetical protein B0H10DRAFT_2019560 [Mycena sp. CBHHK59/15]